MSDIKTKAQGLDPNLHARNISKIVENVDNIYEALAIVSKRAGQLSQELKQELNQKLQEFATVTDAIEEVQENKEQIEISKFYERLPNPPLIATEEFLTGQLHWRYNDEKRNKRP